MEYGVWLLLVVVCVGVSMVRCVWFVFCLKSSLQIYKILDWPWFPVLGLGTWSTLLKSVCTELYQIDSVQLDQICTKMVPGPTLKIVEMF
jgi:hypothetical protein